MRGLPTRGGVPSVRKYLNGAMERRGGFTPECKRAVIDLIDRLAREHRDALMDLTAARIVPAPAGTWPGAGDPSTPDVRGILDRIMAGERPFEEWMRAHGHSDGEIAEVYASIDRWPIDNGIVSPRSARLDS